MRTRKNPRTRKEELLEIAIGLAVKQGYRSIKRGDIAKKAKISYGLLTRYYSMDKLKKEVLKSAIAREIIEIIAQGLAHKDKLTKNLPTHIFDKVVEFLKN